MRNFLTKLKYATSTSALILGGGVTFLAQAADTNDASEAIFEEIIVTAAKRSQSLQEVAMAVSAISEAELDRRGVDDLGEYFRAVPGIQYTDFGATGRRGERKLSIRGISGSSEGGPLVGYYIDETPLTASDPILFDVNRIEVLRGPQGTLYGAGTAGGTIKVVTNKPDATKFLGKVDGTLSSTENGGENYTIKGMVNIPLVEEKLALRVVGYYEDADGFIDSEIAPAGSAQEAIVNSANAEKDNFNDTEIYGVRAAVQFTPTENTTLTASANIHRAKMGGEANHYPTFGDLKIAREIATPQESNFDLFNVTLEHDFGNISFLSASSYFKGTYNGVEDLSNIGRFLIEVVVSGAFATALVAPDGSQYDLATTKKEWTQEFRLMSTDDSAIQWTAGLYYHKEKLFDDTLSFTTNVTLAAAPVVILDEFVFFGSDRDFVSEQYALFGEVYYAVTDKLKVTLGGRWFDYSFTDDGDSTGPFGSGFTTASGSENSFRPKFGVSYQATDDHLLFASVTKGFRTGGKSSPVPDIPACSEVLGELGLTGEAGTFESDTIWNYEAGIKSSWNEGRVIVNATAFYVDWSNIAQSVNLGAINGGCPFSPTLNAGEASSKGFEFESRLSPIDGLDLGVAIAYTDATLGSSPTFGQEDESLLAVPEWTVSLNGEYEFAMTDDYDGFIRADYQYVGKRAFAYTGEGAQYLDSYDLTNVRLGIRKDDWTVALFVNNVTDSRPQLGERDFGSQFRRFTTLRPRTFGINFNANF